MAQDDDAVVRRRLDVVLVAGGLTLLLMTSALAWGDKVSALEEEGFRFFNELPDWLEKPLWPFMQAGAMVTVPTSAVAVWIIWRRWRPAVAIFAAGMSAWVLAKMVKEIVRRERPGELLTGVIERPEWTGLGFVSGHAAIAFALAAVVSPYLPRRWKPLLWLFPVAASVLRIYTGAHLPLDVVGGAGLGLVIAGIVNLALGVPARRAGADSPEDAIGLA